jgi:hypothetical protein
MDNSYAGVKAKDGLAIKATYNGKTIYFAAGEIKVLPAEVVEFLLTRTHYLAGEGGKGLSLRRLFVQVPLTEALKHAKEPENPSIAAAKARLAEEEKARGELKAEILKALKEEGWAPPKAKA